MGRSRGTQPTSNTPKHPFNINIPGEYKMVRRHGAEIQVRETSMRHVAASPSQPPARSVTRCNICLECTLLGVGSKF